MRTNTPLVQRNADFLGQALALLDSLPREAYAQRPPQFERGGVGAHLRHVLDHFDAFLDGVATGCIDYDARARDEATEQEIDVAKARLRATTARLKLLGPLDESPAVWVERELRVSMDLGGRTAGREQSCSSSIGRELQYLVAHTVHHFALIAVALRSCGHQLPADFGVAPSTLRHEEASRGACAR
jgi:uncharacterized damage-inducible protein DinB